MLLLAPVLVSGAFAARAAEASTAAMATATTTVATKRALLIGINHYKAVPSLMGSLNDVAAVQQILTTRWGFAPDNIRVLTDQQATRTAILAALQQLVQESGPNDTVVVHYSGHGSQVQDLNGDEEDGLDETLVPWDGRTAGVPDIVDDELDRIFASLHAAQVLIILDSCHSGTATRGLEFRARSIPRDDRIDLYRETAVTTRAIIPRMKSRFLVMSAVAADQEALDGPLDGEYHGVFTYAFTRALGATAPGSTPRDLFGRVSQELTRMQTQLGHTVIPDPQLEGPPALLDQPLLGAPAIHGAAATHGTKDIAGSSRLAWLATRVRDNRSITLLQGMLMGAAPGSSWAIYPPGESSFAPGRALAIATVTRASGLDADATLEPEGTIPAGARAVAMQPAPAGGRAGDLLALDNPAARISIMARVVGASSPATRDIVLVADTRPAALHARHAGEVRSVQNSLQLEVTVGAEAYLTIADVDTEGNVNLLFPNPSQRSDYLPEGRVHAQQITRIPDTLESGGRAGFFWDYGPPAGLDTIRVFATTDLATATLIRKRIRALQQNAARTRSVSAATVDVPSFDQLRHDLAGLATRGISVTADTAPATAQSESPDWAATSVTVNVAD